jgi:hypothetical protein
VVWKVTMNDFTGMSKHQVVMLTWPFTRFLGFLLAPCTALHTVLLGNHHWDLPWSIWIPYTLGVAVSSYYFWTLFWASVMGLGMLVTGNWSRFWAIIQGRY